MRLKEADQLNEYERRNHLLDTKEYLKEAERLLHGYCRECLIWDIETLLSELDEEIAIVESAVSEESDPSDSSAADRYWDDLI